MKKRFFSVLLCLLLLVGLLPAAVQAAPIDSISGDGNTEKYKWNIRLEDGILYWDNADGAKTHDIQLYFNGAAAGDAMNCPESSRDITAYMRQERIPTGSYTLEINPSKERSAPVNFFYKSPLTRLATPTGLRWEETTAVWEPVADATRYAVSLHASRGNQIERIITKETAYDFTDVRDGDIFCVIAMSGDHLDSDMAYSGEFKSRHDIVVYGGGAYTDNTGSDQIGSQMFRKKVYLIPDIPAGKEFEGWTVEAPEGLVLSDTFPAFFTMPAANVRVRARFSDREEPTTPITPTTPTTITEAYATVTAPVPGANPDFNTVSTPEGANYTAELIGWGTNVDPYKDMMNRYDVFRDATKYFAYVRFTPKTGYTFDNTTKYYINDAREEGMVDGDPSIRVQLFILPVVLLCEHTDRTTHRDVYSTCVSKGNEAYQTCSSCGQIFDMEGHEIAKVPVREPDPDCHESLTPWETDEVDHWRGCAACGKVNIQRQMHIIGSWLVDSPSQKHKECRICQRVLVTEAISPETVLTFADVPQGSYYENAVTWAVANGITTGTDASRFSPEAVCTRAQAVTFLWRAAGCPAPESTKMPFADVKSGSYYYDAVLWAVEKGITTGMTQTAFGPEATCSRAQIVTFLWRSLDSPTPEFGKLFSDVELGAYYFDPVLWAVSSGVTNGTTDTTFSPFANCTRAQIVTFIYRAVK